MADVTGSDVTIYKSSSTERSDQSISATPSPQSKGNLLRKLLKGNFKGSKKLEKKSESHHNDNNDGDKLKNNQKDIDSPNMKQKKKDIFKTKFWGGSKESKRKNSNIASSSEDTIQSSKSSNKSNDLSPTDGKGSTKLKWSMTRLVR